jgi:3'-phosphoadenosine 5'-phosphosulfate sulfotransferase (PAPS reductase)/FAD synthetase
MQKIPPRVMLPAEFIGVGRAFPAPPVASTPTIDAALAAHAAVGIGVSGGKDSQALAWRTIEYLDEIGHRGPRVLIHADLGRVEWSHSLPSCEETARKLNTELIVVARKAGDMFARWEQRWKNNCDRYINLECVKLILPWSTPSARFCTSEMKADSISSALKKRFPAQTIISASGIRREESSARAKAPVSAPNAKLTTKKITGYTWNPIVDWRLADHVLPYIASRGDVLHPAYTEYGASRVSCAYCIMSTQRDLKAATTYIGNHDVYRLMVDLEIRSTFAFQGAHWLGDTEPALLSTEQRAALGIAKAKAAARIEIESRIPKHLLYTNGWPTVAPTAAEAQMLAEVRTAIAKLMKMDINYTTAAAIAGRYEELMAAKAAKDATLISADEPVAASETDPVLATIPVTSIRRAVVA